MRKPYFDTIKIEENAFSGVEVQVCWQTKTVGFHAWDYGNGCDLGDANIQSTDIPFADAKRLIAWIAEAIAKAEVRGETIGAHTPAPRPE